ncbi:MAG: hypothetical protein JW888_18620, partial [Pirellulales bacterium]|nr:hypothetical protein [Pirellulales bacterium]
MAKTSTLNSTRPLVLDLLLKKGRLEESDLLTIQEAQRKERLSIEETLLKKRLVSERDIAEVYSEYLMVPLFEPASHEVRVDLELSRLFSEKLCRDHLLAPVAIHDNVLEVAFFTANSLHIVDELQWLTGLTVSPMIAPLSAVEGILGTLFEDASWPGSSNSDSGGFGQVDEDEEGGEGSDDGNNDEVLHLDQPPPPGRDGRIIRFVNQMFEQAFRAG